MTTVRLLTAFATKLLWIKRLPCNYSNKKWLPEVKLFCFGHYLPWPDRTKANRPGSFAEQGRLQKVV